jgi:hypothetical protein
VRMRLGDAAMPSDAALGTSTRGSELDVPLGSGDAINFGFKEP